MEAREAGCAQKQQQQPKREYQTAVDEELNRVSISQKVNVSVIGEPARQIRLEGVWESEFGANAGAGTANTSDASAVWLLLQEHYPEQYPQSILRTLQRRVRQWKATAGDAKPVVFDLKHMSGEMGCL